LNFSIFLALAALIISIASFFWSIHLKSGQDKKWHQLNKPNPFLKEISFVKFKKITKSEAMSINWGYQNPSIYADGEATDYFYIPNYLGVFDLTTNQKILGVNPVFTIDEINDELIRKEAHGDFFIQRCFKLKVLLENRGKLPVIDLSIEIETRLPNHEWEFVFQNDSLIRLEESQNSTISLDFYLPLDNIPEQIDFRISKSWVINGNDKQNIITCAKWTSKDDYFSYL
jgi:hypothetical protein